MRQVLQICSVTNGRMDVIIQACDARLLQVSIELYDDRTLPSLYKRGLANSIYQSQYVFQMKSYTELAASPSSNLSRLEVTLCTVSLYF